MPSAPRIHILILLDLEEKQGVESRSDLEEKQGAESPFEMVSSAEGT